MHVMITNASIRENINTYCTIILIRVRVRVKSESESGSECGSENLKSNMQNTDRNKKD